MAARGLVIYLCLFLLALPAPTISYAGSARYYVPAAAPLALSSASLMTFLWRSSIWRTALRIEVGAAVLIWLVYAIPFLVGTWTDPEGLRFKSQSSFIQFQSGYITGDEAARQAGALLNAPPDPLPVRLLADHEACGYMYFFVVQTLDCVKRGVERAWLTELMTMVPPGESVLLVEMIIPEGLRDLAGTCWEEIAVYLRPISGAELRIWRIWRGACPE